MVTVRENVWEPLKLGLISGYNLPPISHFRQSRMHSSIARNATSFALSSSALKLGYSCVSSTKQRTCGRWRSITLKNDEQQGSQQEPWGTPQLSKNCLESDPSMDTCWLRFDRYELKESSTFPRIPTSLCSRSNKISWSTVPNAALRSNRTIRVTCCGFIFKRTSFISLSQAVSVLWCWR